MFAPGTHQADIDGFLVHAVFPLTLSRLENPFIALKHTSVLACFCQTPIVVLLGIATMLHACRVSPYVAVRARVLYPSDPGLAMCSMLCFELQYSLFLFRRFSPVRSLITTPKLTSVCLRINSRLACIPRQLSHADTRIVSLTVTEKGYCQDVNGDLDRVR